MQKIGIDLYIIEFRNSHDALLAKLDMCSTQSNFHNVRVLFSPPHGAI